jgi:hypothetical protein
VSLIYAIIGLKKVTREMYKKKNIYKKSFLKLRSPKAKKTSKSSNTSHAQANM